MNNGFLRPGSIHLYASGNPDSQGRLGDSLVFEDKIDVKPRVRFGEALFPWVPGVMVCGQKGELAIVSQRDSRWFPGNGTGPSCVWWSELGCPHPVPGTPADNFP